MKASLLQSAGLAVMPLRWVTGWLFFSALHRRVVLAPLKMDPDAPGYLGAKFNTFMPGATAGVGDMIAWLIDHPQALQAFLWTFTIIEGLVGLALLTGLLTRLSAIGVSLLSAGILLGAGWLGPTCLDEWQIGAFGIVGGMAIAMAGPGPLSLDSVVARRLPQLAAKRGWQWLADGPAQPPRMLAVALASIALVTTLGTNQLFHGGVWGSLHNDSVHPRIELLSAQVSRPGALTITFERPEGPETYGAFVMEIRLLDEAGTLVANWDEKALATLPKSAIENRWLVKVKSGAHGLVVPLAARASLVLHELPEVLDGLYRVEFEDVSGRVWRKTFELSAAPSNGWQQSML